MDENYTNNSLEDIIIQGLELREDGWYMKHHNKGGSEPVWIKEVRCIVWENQ